MKIWSVQPCVRPVCAVHMTADRKMHDWPTGDHVPDFAPLAATPRRRLRRRKGG
jgi:hypothetical protein